MPRRRWILALGAFALTAAAAAAADFAPQPDCSCRQGPVYGCQGCGARHAAPGLPLTPGCCQPQRTCCNNAWEGYCRDKARWQNFWCKVGTGALYPCTPCEAHNGRGVALEVQVRPGAAACGAPAPQPTLAPALNPQP